MRYKGGYSIVGGAASAFLVFGALAWAQSASVIQQSIPDAADTCAYSGGDKAIIACTTVISSGKLADNELAPWLNMRAEHYARQNDCNNAIADFERAVQLDPTKLSPALASMLIKRGLTYAERHDHDHAIADLDQAATYEPKSAILFMYRGEAFDALGDPQRAKEAREQAESLYPGIVKFSVPGLSRCRS
jgi:tetratricopeptide (TPR) repeat protein